MPAGRPTKYKKEFVETAKFLAEKGFTDKEVSKVLGVTETTLNTWKKNHPEFLVSLKAGKAISDAEVERSLFERATGYSHPEDKIFNDNGTPLVVPITKRYPPDTTAAIFWLKNRRPNDWREKQQVTTYTMPYDPEEAGA